jgi:hypothetical protein
MSGEIFVYISIAESQNYFNSEVMREWLINLFDNESLEEIIEQLRKYCEGVRAFWRQDRTLAH